MNVVNNDKKIYIDVINLLKGLVKVINKVNHDKKKMMVSLSYMRV